MQIKIKGILSFPHLFTPRAVQQGDEPKYSASILLHKVRDAAAIAQVQQAIDTEIANGFPSGFPHNGKLCMNDCQVKNPGDPTLAEYMVVNSGAKADMKPAVVDSNLDPVMDPAAVYPGAECWFALNTFVYSMSLSKGIGCGLNGVMLTGQEGALGRLDSRPTVDQMFGDVSGGAPAPATPGAAPNAPQPPAAPQPPQPPQPPAAPPAAPQYQMTAAAAGISREEYHKAGWSDDLLIQNGYMLPPNGVTPSFQQ